MALPTQENNDQEHGMTTVEQDIQAAFDEFLAASIDYQEEILHEAITERDMVIENMMAAIRQGDSQLVGMIVVSALKDYVHDIDTATPKHPVDIINGWRESLEKLSIIK